jgi:1,4-alpha-glucan branching enzyme
MISVPGVLFKDTFNRYFSFLNIWAEKPSSIKKTYTNMMPEIHNKGRIKYDKEQFEPKLIRFYIKNKSAKEIAISGDFNKWKINSIKLVKTSGDLWETFIALAPGKYKYVYYVDGEKMLDPYNPDVDYIGNEKVSLINVK